MALYFYEAFSQDGKKVSGNIDAPSIQNVKEQLAKKGLFPTTIYPDDATGRKKWFKNIFTQGVSTKDKILFTKQLTILLRSGIPLLQALELLTEQFTGILHTTIVQIKDNIKEGLSLAQALQKHKHIFDTIYIQLVRAGEASGNLEKILDRLTQFLERRAAITQKVRSALMMPIIQLCVAAAVVAFLMIKVVPVMGENFAEQGKELPGTTQFLMNLSDFFVSYYLIIVIGIIGAIIAFSSWKKSDRGAHAIDTLLLKAPYIQYFARTNAIVQFSHTLGMLIESGVNLSESLDIVCKIIDNRVLADALLEARDKIIKQGKIAQYLKQTNIFPAIAIYLIKTGEQTGKLDTMLLTVAHNYEEELSEKIDKLSSLFGVALLLVMAVVVGFIVISIALPLTQMGDIGNV